jgi:hypothetical protein
MKGVSVMFDLDLKEFIDAVLPGYEDERPDKSRGAVRGDVFHGSCNSRIDCTTGAFP